MNRRVEKTVREILPQEIEAQWDYMTKIREKISDGPKTAFVVTYGCQQNEADSERIAGMLREMGYAPASSVASADLIIVNTCAIRDHAEKKALSITGGYKHLKAKKPSLLIGICGCMVSKPDMNDRLRKSYPYIDFVFGTEYLWRLPEILYRVITEDKRLFFPNEGAPVIAEGIPVTRESPFHAWVSIMYGCNNFCTYCIVPYVRGGERSRRPEDILSEIQGLVENGCREITLLGQNVNSYGKYSGWDCDFSALLRKIAELPGDFIIRFMTSHPKDASHELIDTMAAYPKIARQFHLPVQSGSDRILHEMNRNYTRESYLSLVRYMRERMPDITVTSDIIVGFPGETEEDFRESYAFAEEIGFAKIHVFPYSPKRGTPAAARKDQLLNAVKSERSHTLIQLSDRMATDFLADAVGTDAEVLYERAVGEGIYEGHTTNYMKVHGRSETDLTNRIAKTHITRAEGEMLFGDVEV